MSEYYMCPVCVHKLLPLNPAYKNDSLNPIFYCGYCSQYRRKYGDVKIESFWKFLAEKTIPYWEDYAKEKILKAFNLKGVIV